MTAVVNTSPLVVLTKVLPLGLLPALYGDVVILHAVVDEVLAKRELVTPELEIGHPPKVGQMPFEVGSPEVAETDAPLVRRHRLERGIAAPVVVFGFQPRGPARPESDEEPTACASTSTRRSWAR